VTIRRDVARRLSLAQTNVYDAGVRTLFRCVVTLLLAAGANAATITVPNTDASGPGSLRDAIAAAHATPEADTIVFSIGTGAQTIAVNTSLPAATAPLTIDGTTQPGYGGVPLITLKSPVSGGPPYALTLEASAAVRALRFVDFGSGILGKASLNVVERNEFHNPFAAGFIMFFVAGSSGNIIRGNTITGNGQGINLEASGNHVVQGNRVSGRNALSANGSGNQIGGVLAGEGNTFTSVSSLPAVSLFGSGNRLEGNTINGGKAEALLVGGNNNTIGGTAAGARNIIIAGPSSIGCCPLAVQITGNGHTLIGNHLNVDAAGAPATSATALLIFDTGIGNHRIGAAGGGGNRIHGSVQIGALNTMFENNIITGDGSVSMFSPSRGSTFLDNLIAQRVSISEDSTGNRFRGNTFRPPGKGVEIFPPTANDPGDADTGPNNHQNHPVITAAADSSAGSTIAGTLSSTASTAFTLEFFTGSVCGESNPVGTMNVTTDAAGNAPFVFTTARHTNVVTATATDPANNTSPMAPCVTSAAADVLLVSAADVRFAEGDARGEVTVMLSHPLATAFTVDYTVSGGTATAGSDFIAASGTLAFAPGETSKTIPVTTMFDLEAEQDETIVVTLWNASQGTIANGTATVTLTNVGIPDRRRAIRK
jgi:trimeric autotransporter adhesin